MACPRATGPKFKDMRTSIWEVFLNGVLLEQIKKNINKIVWSFLSGLFKWGSVRTNKENQWNCLDSPTQQGTMCNGLKRLGSMLPLLRIARAEVSFKRYF